MSTPGDQDCLNCGISWVFLYSWLQKLSQSTWDFTKPSSNFTYLENLMSTGFFTYCTHYHCLPSFPFQIPFFPNSSLRFYFKSLLSIQVQGQRWLRKYYEERVMVVNNRKIWVSERFGCVYLRSCDTKWKLEKIRRENSNKLNFTVFKVSKV